MTGPGDCIDVFSGEPTVWAFDVEISGPRRTKVSSLYLNIRESHPGDFCWRFSDDPRLFADDDPSDDTITFTLRTDTHGVPSGDAAPEGVIPASVNEEACRAGNLVDPTDTAIVATLLTTGPRNGATVTVTVHPATLSPHRG